MGFCDVLLYINGIFCYVAGYSALSVTFGDSSPRGGAKAYPNTRIGAFLPLPSGEVAARSADGEGVRGNALLARRLIQRAVSRRVGHRPALFKPTLFFPRQLSIVNSSACSTNARSSVLLRSSCGAAARARREARFSSARSAAPSMPSCAARTHCSTAQASL